MIRFEDILGKRVDKTRVIPVTLKIVIIFTLMIFVSNLTSNYINLMFNRTELLKLMKQLLAGDLKEINSYSNTQYEIFTLNQDRDAALQGIEKKAKYELKRDKSLSLGVSPTGEILFQAYQGGKKAEKFSDEESLRSMRESKKEGFLTIRYDNLDFFAVFKYNPEWDMFIIRGEEKGQFYSRQRTIFRNISIVILLMTLASAIVGIYLLSHILRYIGIITNAIMAMVENQRLEVIDLKKAPNDDITYMGMAFNSLSTTIDNLVGIFRKFTNKDIVIKAYRDRQVLLEGEQKQLTILFSDIKSFTMITEALGNDIIKLLNLHYDQAIREIQDHNGIVSAIIGDALLAVYGVFEDEDEDDAKQSMHLSDNKSFQAVLSAYKVQEVARSLRREMRIKKEEIIAERGGLSRAEAKTYRAVLLEVGVGIDGGNVFYGTIGSYVRMTNTVIGDNVNAASRLEGLTRVYRAPVICSNYVKDDIEKNVPGHSIRFLELDRVKVKGKTEWKAVYFPIPEIYMTEKLQKELEIFSAGLELYYRGDWEAAYGNFRATKLKLARPFRERIRGNKPPEDWNGIWEMKSK